MISPQNILQYEFFHVGGSGVSFEAVSAECAERALEALELSMNGHEYHTGIKTVIRIYDTEGAITVLSHKITKLEAYTSKLSVMPRKSAIHNIIIGFNIKFAHRWSDMLRRRLSLYAVDYLDRALKEPLGVAVERVDYSFREVRRDELFELAQAAKVAKDFWLFILQPNSLLANKNENVVSVM